MKKILSTLFALALFAACSDNKKATDSLAQYFEVYDGLSANRNVALDPFIQAYRYHLYQAGGATDALKSQFFPSATITESEDGQRVTLQFTEIASPNGDFSRSGELTIHTGGRSLAEEGAEWRVTTSKDEEKYYNVLYPGRDYWHLEMETGAYTVSNAGTTNGFRVRADAIFMSSYYLESVWNWDLDMIVTRTEGTGSELTGSRFEIAAAEGTSAGGGYNTTADMRYRYEILEPLLYAADCGFLVKSGGVERIVRTERLGFKGLDSLRADLGQTYNSCAPALTFSVRAEADSVWTTHHYDPYGNWID